MENHFVLKESGKIHWQSPDGELIEVSNQEDTIQQIEWAYNQPKGGLNRKGKVYSLQCHVEIETIWLREVNVFGEQSSVSKALVTFDSPLVEEQRETQDNNGWVSVNERLPEERFMAVLIFNASLPHYMQCVQQAAWFQQTGTFKIEATGEHTNDVTHWMPLPQPPKQ
jgi:hypothetical protein